MREPLFSFFLSQKTDAWMPGAVSLTLQSNCQEGRGRCAASPAHPTPAWPVGCSSGKGIISGTIFGLGRPGTRLAAASLHTFGQLPHPPVTSGGNYQNAEKTNRSCFYAEPQTQGENSRPATSQAQSRMRSG